MEWTDSDVGVIERLERASGGIRIKGRELVAVTFVLGILGGGVRLGMLVAEHNELERNLVGELCRIETALHLPPAALCTK